MKFCDKLPKLRKGNNYSQEQLAEKLNVSRQTISKWETGDSYPEDMERLLEICRVLNCSLEDLIDDGVAGESSATTQPSKTKFNTYLKDFLDFITKSYNMFCCMTFKENLKLILEMATICLILFIVSSVLSHFIASFFWQVLGHGEVGSGLVGIITWVIDLAFLVASTVIVLHLFKIRYLDYFVTIEDQNVAHKQIEKAVEETAAEESTGKEERGLILEKTREKIVIRDAKHSAWKFFDFLGKIILLIVKGLVIVFIALPVVAILLACVVGVAAAIYHTQYSWLFFWAIWLFVGGGLLGYVILEWAYNFIFNQKQHPKKLFFFIIGGLVSIGVGMALPLSILFNTYRTVSFEASDYLVTTETFTVDEKTLFYCDDYRVTCEIKEGTEGVVVAMEGVQISPPVLSRMDHDAYGQYERYMPVVGYVDALKAYQLFMVDLKQGQIRDYGFNPVRTTATMSAETFEILQANRLRFEEELAWRDGIEEPAPELDESETASESGELEPELLAE